MASPRFVILVLDGLRPDYVTPGLMPNLSAFRDQAAVLAGSRAQFPTHTRVQKTSLATGTIPRHHGVLFNKMFDPALDPDAVVDIGDPEVVRRTEEHAPIITAPTIGSVLAGAGKRLAVIHCGMPGAPWLLNFRGTRYGQEHLSLSGYRYGTPKLARLVEAKLGPMAEHDKVDHGRSAFALRALTEVAWPALAPDVALLWCDEPDKSLHVDGLDGPVATAAIRHCDGLVGDLVAWWRALPDRDAVNLSILSDHGHSQTTRSAPLVRAFAASGLPVTTDPRQPGAVLVAMPSGGVHLRGQDPALLDDIAGWMRAQPFVGHLFSDDKDGVAGMVDGTFSKALIGIDHTRAPDLFFTLRHDDGTGECFGMGQGAPSGSMHGGVHRTQMRTVSFHAGPSFRTRHVSKVPGGMIDIVPSMLDLMGVAAPPTMVGRPLRDLFAAGGAQADADVAVETLTVGTGGYSQSLAVRRLSGRTIVEHGWTGAGAFTA